MLGLPHLPAEDRFVLDLEESGLPLTPGEEQRIDANIARCTAAIRRARPYVDSRPAGQGR